MMVELMDSDVSAAGQSVPPEGSVLPLGYVGLVAPMNSLGFAPSPGLGLVYTGALVLLPAQQLVLSVQRRKAAEEVRDLPYDEAVSRSNVRVYRADDMTSAELERPFTGYRLNIGFGDTKSVRFILQTENVAEVRRCFRELLGARFVDSSGADTA